MEELIMGIVHIMKRGGDDLYEYKKALKMVKKGIEKLCELTDDMEDEYGYKERDEHEDWDESQERRYRRDR